MDGLKAVPFLVLNQFKPIQPIFDIDMRFRST
jgi:hypothetical protein